MFDDLARVDWALDAFFQQLDRLELADATNVVVVSDHGMSDVRRAVRRQLAEFTDVR